MKIEDLEAFVAVAKTSNISAAAKRLGIPQATLSDRLRSLERELGRLFERRKRPPWVKRTDLGERLLAYAIDVLEAADRLRAARAGGDGRRRPVRVGANQSIEQTWLYAWVARLRREQPALALALRVDTTDALDEAMASADLDLALAARPLGDRDVEKRQLPSLEMAFVGSAARHPRKATHRFADLARAGLVTFQAGSQPHRAVVKLLRAAGIDDARVDLCWSIPSMIQAVQHGLGVATLPAALVARAPEHGLRVLACDVALPALPVWLSWPRPIGREAEAAVASLLAFVKDDLDQPR